jgi:Arc/MetJ-type ribon-helix-helix transcriptional regulator
MKTTITFAKEDYEKLKRMIDSGKYRTIVDAISDLIRRSD